MFNIRSCGLKAALILGTCCLILLGLEARLRLSHEPIAIDTNDILLRRSSFFQRDEQLGWLPRPQMAGEHPYYGRTIPFHTNSHGWRDREYSLEDNSRTTRIVVLGDAFSWGYYVRDQEVYPKVLESLLEQTDVINLGVPGFATDQEIQYFKRTALPYQPDTVILAFYLDNFYEADGKLVRQALASPAEEPSKAPQSQSEPVTGPVLRLKRYLKGHSALYRWGQEQLATNNTIVKMLSRAGLREPLGGIESLDVSLLPALKDTPDSIAPLIQLVEAKLLELDRLLTERGIRFIIVLIPSEASIEQRAFDRAIAPTKFDRDDFDLDQPYRLLEEFAKRNAIELINPTDAFRAIHRADDSLYLVHDKHFSPKGHQVFAQEIYRYLAQDDTYIARPAPSTREESSGG
ncbi:MAG: hypothetical protein A2V62_04060 [Nitrospirae bacterium RBG_19FT_COMBO_58_9]|nr:MAG: hypothetical protein A2V62_04060 [Nitrospirae bacterium RBG_19FT_COMBO_58_9]